MSEFDFETPEIDEEAYDEESYQTFPTISWFGKAGTDNDAGWFSINQDALSVCPAGWAEHEHVFGANPTATPTPVYVCRDLGFIPIARRQRFIVTADDGRRYFYPWYTRREKKVPGKNKGHIQVMGKIDGFDDLVVLGFQGYAKTHAWNNEEEKDGWALGVEYRLKEYAALATKQKREDGYKGGMLPHWCMWKVNLIPQVEFKTVKNKKVKQAVWLDLGHDTYYNVFVANLDTSAKKGDGLPETRFVGLDTYLELESLRKEIGIPWEQDPSFGAFESVEASDSDTGNGSEENDVPVGVSNDPIPF